jgi:hypothetical protein
MYTHRESNMYISYIYRPTQVPNEFTWGIYATTSFFFFFFFFSHTVDCLLFLFFFPAHHHHPTLGAALPV